jgi:hypothetical protein
LTTYDEKTVGSSADAIIDSKKDYEEKNIDMKVKNTGYSLSNKK